MDGTICLMVATSGRIVWSRSSVHINNTDNPNEFHNVLAKLKVASKKSPIGCRDFATKRFLQSNDIACFFSSCLTTTLQRKDYSDG